MTDRTLPDRDPLQENDPVRLGDYEILGRLGEGGQGTVFLGRAAGEHVAIKLLHARLTGDDAARARFVRELEVAKRVARFCTAQVLDAAVDVDRPYIVSEYVAGRSLHRLVAAEGPRTGGSLERLAIGTLTALTAIHQAGIVHRDFKPHNVMIGSDGPRVIDFGVARALGAAGETQQVGTPSYMSPEHFEGAPIGPAADMFAWANTMIFAATGKPAFGNDEMAAVMHRIMHTDPDLSALPEPLHDVVADCLAKDPAKRPTARQAQDRLVNTAAGAEEPAPVVVPLPETPPPAAWIAPPLPPPAAPPAPAPPQAEVTPATVPQVPPAVPTPVALPQVTGPQAPPAGRAPGRGVLVGAAAMVAAAVLVAGGVVWAATRSDDGGGTARDGGQAQAAPGDDGGQRNGGPGNAERVKEGGKAASGPAKGGTPAPSGSPSTSAPVNKPPESRGSSASLKPTPTKTGRPPEKPNPYTPQQVCNTGGHGGGYYVQRSTSFAGGRTYQLYNSSGYNCAVTMKTTDVGRASSVWTRIERKDGAKSGDNGSFKYYAGPVFVYGKGKCVRYAGGTKSASTSAPWGNCG